MVAKSIIVDFTESAMRQAFTSSQSFAAAYHLASRFDLSAPPTPISMTLQHHPLCTGKETTIDLIVIDNCPDELNVPRQDIDERFGCVSFQLKPTKFECFENQARELTAIHRGSHFENKQYVAGVFIWYSSRCVAQKMTAASAAAGDLDLKNGRRRHRAVLQNYVYTIHVHSNHIELLFGRNECTD